MKNQGKPQWSNVIQTVGKDKILLLILAGVILAASSIPWNDKKEDGESETVQKEETKTLVDYQNEMEEKLERLISSIDGAGEVKVMVTFSASSEKILKENHEYVKSEEGKEGEENSQIENKQEMVILEDAKGNQVAVVQKEITPQVEGAAIVAQGGGDARIKQQIIDAVKALLDIDVNKISVAKMKEG